MKVLVTGSAGTVGDPLCAELESRGHEVYGLDLFHVGEDGFFRADVAEMAQLRSVVEIVEPELVFHLAAEFGRMNGEHYNRQMWNSNAVGTKNVLALQERMGFRLVHASSSEVYGLGPFDRPLLDEEMTGRIPLRHHNDYAMSKWVNEQQVRNSATPELTTVVRLFNSYGPGEHYHPYRSVICLFCHCMLRGLPIVVHQDHHRVFTYIDDFVRTLANCTEVQGGETINIGGNEYRSVMDMYEIVRANLGTEVRSKVKFVDRDTTNTLDKRADISKARHFLGHEITVSLEMGIQRTLEWMRSAEEVVQDA